MLTPQRTLPLVVLAAIVAAGCRVGPEARVPEVELAQHFSLAAEATANERAWWRELRDPLLESWVEECLLHNFDLRIAYERLVEARAAAGVPRSSWGPTVNAEAFYLDEDRGPATRAPGQPTEIHAVGLSASWEMDFFGRVARTVESAEAQVAVTEEARHAAWVSVLGELGVTYYRWRGHQAVLAIEEQNLELQRSTLQLIRDRRAAGLAAELEEQSVIREVELLRSRIASLRGDLRSDELRLEALRGELPGRTVAPDPRELPPVPALVELGVPSDLLRRRPDIRRAEREIEQACAQLGIAVADMYPRVFLFSGAGWQGVSADDLFEAPSRLLSVLPSVQWSLFQSGALRARVDVEESRYRQRLLRYEQVVQLAMEDVESQLTRFVNERDRYRALRRASEAATRSFDRARDLYREGLTDFIQLQDSQRAANQARARAARSHSETLARWVRLYVALGGAWEVAAERVASR